MRVMNTDAAALEPELRQQAYNALDAALTVGIWEKLNDKLKADSAAAMVYGFEMAMQPVAMTMAVRGIAVNEVMASQEIDKLLKAEAACIRNLRTLAEVWLGDEAGELDLTTIAKGLLKGKPTPGMSPHSPVGIKKLFYEACGEKPYKSRKKQTDVSQLPSTVNEEALMALQARSSVVGIMAHLVLRARELRKLRSFIAARRSPDGRLRSSFNVGATTSGRWSFSKNCFGDGLNFGNIPKSARAMFVPSEPEWIMVNVDLKQAESFIVAHISDDEAYIKAHAGGDVHGAVAMDVYGELMPPGADWKTWVRQPHPAVPRGDSPRQACKKLAHGTAYGVGERTSSKVTGLPISDIVRFRNKFFAKYAGVNKRIQEIGNRLRRNPRFVSLLGRPHRHMGHPADGETHRSALADEPQGVVADVLNVALWRLWARFDVGGEEPKMRMLSQAYDSVLFECRREDLEEVRKAVKEAFDVRIMTSKGPIVIPHDFGWGRNWKEACGA